MGAPAFAQDTSADQDTAAIEPAPEATETTAGTRVFTPADFARFSPRNALDMLQQVPGFTLRGEDDQRGLGQATANVLIDGERVASKSDSVFSRLQRIGTEQVERIEIVDGAAFGIPGLSGQVANVITRPDPLSGQFTYRAQFRPKYAEPNWLGGEVSLSGSGERLNWTAAIGNGTGRGAAGGGKNFLYGPEGQVLEQRFPEFQFVGDFPRVSGTLNWTNGSGVIANANANYNRSYQRFTENEYRDLVTGIDRLRFFENRYRGWGYEFGGDVEFGLLGGRLKLIGLESYSRGRSTTDSALDYDDERRDTGSRYASQAESGERIGRAEFRWDMLGGGWQLDIEAAHNRYERDAQLFDLGEDGDYAEIPLPGSSGGVTEDRYESILTHNRSLAGNLTLQIGAGAEHSTLSQTGPIGLTRSFLRPKGSLNLGWQVEEGLELSLEFARRVGQLQFGDFLASVSLQQGQENAGNADLVPPQSWEAKLEATRDLGEWGSTNVRLFARFIDDYIDIIPVEGGRETVGNLDSASIDGIRWNTTFQLDPIGFRGAKLEATIQLEETSLADPLTGIRRQWSGHQDREFDLSLRHDVPGSDWAWGAGLEYNHTLPYYRLGEVGLNDEGPIYTFAFLEHKDVFGMTANLSVFNLTDGRGRTDRYVYDGYRDRSPLLFRETRDLSVQPIFSFSLSGDF
ncbi:MAG: TonB-dependent receptor plug domain-containing protein [Alteraurantiacibacter sp.]